jgi:hypothetical protein
VCIEYLPLFQGPFWLTHLSFPSDDSHGHVTSLGTRWSTMIALGTSWCSQTCGAALGLCETQLVRPKSFFSKMFWEPRSPWCQVLDLFMVFWVPVMWLRLWIRMVQGIGPYGLLWMVVGGDLVSLIPHLWSWKVLGILRLNIISWYVCYIPVILCDCIYIYNIYIFLYNMYIYI